MITRQNIFTEYPKINQGILPSPLQKDEFEDFKDLFDAYHEDSTIAESVDTFIQKLNDVLSSQKKDTSKKLVSKARKIKLRRIVKKQPSVKAKKEPKAKVEKTPKQKKQKFAKPKKEVFKNIPEWLLALRKCARMANREYSQIALRNYLHFIQKSFSEKRAGATKTPYIDKIVLIQNNLISCLNKNLKAKKIIFNVPNHLIESIHSILNKYMVKMEKDIEAVPDKLMGMKNGLGSLGIIETSELASMDFQTLPFTGKFKDLIGSPTKPFQIMVYGLPGSGKSTLAIMFAKYLAENHQFKVLYLAKEEGISGTSQEKFIRLNAIHPNIHIAEKMPTDLSFYDVLFIDSVNEMNMTPDNLRAIIKQYPKLSTFQLFKATKEGKFLGQSDFAHLCQAEIRCFENTAQAQKNRFGGNQEIKILD